MAKSSLSPSSHSAAAPGKRVLVQRAGLVRSDAPMLGNLWQMPLLLVSLGLFTLGAYLFIDPQPAPAFERQLAIASRDMEAERYDAAIGRINDLLAAEPEPADSAKARLLVAEALDRQLRRSRRLESPQAHRRIIAEIQAAYAAGVAATSLTSDRLARSHEALGQIDDATANYRRAAELFEQEGKPEHAVPMRRSAIDMLVAAGRHDSAQDALEEFLDVPGLSDDERAWAFGELARLHIDAERPAEARSLLAAAQALSPDDSIRGQVSYRLGYAAWKLGEPADAKRHLEQALELIGAGHFLEPEAVYLLGRLAQDQEALADARSHYQRVLSDHPASRAAPRAQLGLGMVQLLLGENEAGARELETVARAVDLGPSLAPLRPETLAALQRAGRILAERGEHRLALDLLAQEEAVAQQPHFERCARRGLELERLAGQLLAQAGVEPDAQAIATLHGLLAEAGDAYVQSSRLMAQEGADGDAPAFWKGIELYERAGDHPRMLAALERFAADRPQDADFPAVLAKLGHVSASAGQPAGAIQAWMRLHREHPQSQAAGEIAVPLARALIAQGPARYGEAELVLRSVVDAGGAAEPVRQQGLWELGHLYYRTGRYIEALARLEAMDVPTEPSQGPGAAQLAFLRADCLRKQAVEAISEATRPPDPLDPDGADAQLAAGAGGLQGPAGDSVRRSLEAAIGLFDQAIEMYRQAPAATPLDRTYERLAWFYRADCLFDLGRFQEAIDSYTATVRRYDDDPSALAAHIQIASACRALGRTADARAANERARWLLKRLGPEALTDGRFTLSRDYWEQWLAWSAEASADGGESD